MRGGDNPSILAFIFTHEVDIETIIYNTPLERKVIMYIVPELDNVASEDIKRSKRKLYSKRRYDVVTM